MQLLSTLSKKAEWSVLDATESSMSRVHHTNSELIAATSFPYQHLKQIHPHVSFFSYCCTKLPRTCQFRTLEGFRYFLRKLVMTYCYEQLTCLITRFVEQQRVCNARIFNISLQCQVAGRSSQSTKGWGNEDSGLCHRKCASKAGGCFNNFVP